MKTCSKCGCERPLDQFRKHARQCRDCIRAYHRERSAKRRKDPAYIALQAECHRRWYEANREQEIAKQRSYREPRRAQLSARAVDWARRNPEKRKRLVAADGQRRRGLVTDADARVYMGILLADPCSYCGGPGGEIDHIRAVSRDGPGDWDNLTAACRSCNASKKARSLLAFLAA